jgi:hypothetical protein
MSNTAIGLSVSKRASTDFPRRDRPPRLQCLSRSHIAMKLPRKLQWDPKTERFVNDNEANAMLSRPQRKTLRYNQY